MRAFRDFPEPLPSWEDANERLYGERVSAGPSFDEIVDRLMYMGGLDRDEAELRACHILEDDAA